MFPRFDLSRVNSHVCVIKFMRIQTAVMFLKPSEAYLGLPCGFKFNTKENIEMCPPSVDIKSF